MAHQRKMFSETGVNTPITQSLFFSARVYLTCGDVLALHTKLNLAYIQNQKCRDGLWTTDFFNSGIYVVRNICCTEPLHKESSCHKQQSNSERDELFILFKRSLLLKLNHGENCIL